MSPEHFLLYLKEMEYRFNHRNLEPVGFTDHLVQVLVTNEGSEPSIPVDRIDMNSRVLVVAAHTDDETLGCGGSIYCHVSRGDEVAALHLTDGVGARNETDDDAEKIRSRAAEEASDVLGFDWIATGNFPDNQLDSVPLLEVVQFVERVNREYAPTLVYTHHGGDLNVDHRIAFEATMTAFRPEPSENRVEIRSFEVPSSTEWSHRTIGANFQPNLFVDIGAAWQKKREALKAYSREIRPAPHARSMQSIDALARYRGAEVGVDRAEAFELIRRMGTP